MLSDVAAVYDSSRIRMCITGGEPILHPDIEKIVTDAHNLGFVAGMTTNGTLIDDVLAKFLAEAGLNSAAVSIIKSLFMSRYFGSNKGAVFFANIRNLKVYAVSFT